MPSSKDDKAPQAERRENALVPSNIIRELQTLSWYRHSHNQL